MTGEQKPQVVGTRQELRAARAQMSGRVGLVMTMGALHEGHLDLVRAVKERAEQVIVSIFVNPTQFAPGEDYAAYPRTLEADLEKLAPLGVDLVFAPAPEEMYETGRGEGARVRIDPGPLAAVLEGRTRPTHFAGVCEVVAKVFHLTRPDVAAFGRKDAQQLAIIQQMVRDLDFPLEILPVAIRREADGLAMSSRNAYLSAEERQRALALSRALRAGKAAADGSAVDGSAAADGANLAAGAGELRDGAGLAGGESGGVAAVLAAARAVLDGAQVELDYLTLVSEADFAPVEEGFRGRAILAVAAKVGRTRLIDNEVIDL